MMAEDGPDRLFSGTSTRWSRSTRRAFNERWLMFRVRSGRTSSVGLECTLFLCLYIRED